MWLQVVNMLFLIVWSEKASLSRYLSEVREWNLLIYGANGDEEISLMKTKKIYI